MSKKKYPVTKKSKWSFVILFSLLYAALIVYSGLGVFKNIFFYITSILFILALIRTFKTSVYLYEDHMAIGGATFFGRCINIKYDDIKHVKENKGYLKITTNKKEYSLDLKIENTCELIEKIESRIS